MFITPVDCSTSVRGLFPARDHSCEGSKRHSSPPPYYQMVYNGRKLCLNNISIATDMERRHHPSLQGKSINKSLNPLSSTNNTKQRQLIYTPHGKKIHVCSNKSEKFSLMTFFSNALCSWGDPVFPNLTTKIIVGKQITHFFTSSM